MNKIKKAMQLAGLIVVVGLFVSIAMILAKEEPKKNYIVHFNKTTHYVTEFIDMGECVKIPEKRLKFCGEWSSLQLTQ